MREFKQQFAQLSVFKRMTLISKKIEIACISGESLVARDDRTFVENYNKKRGLKTDWKDVEETISLVTKRQQHQDKTIASDNVAFAFTLHNKVLRGFPM